MARRGPTPGNKRERERAKQAKRVEKEARREQRKAEKLARGDAPEGEEALESPAEGAVPAAGEAPPPTPPSDLPAR